LRYIKKQNPACFITYLMRPEISLKSFDLVAIPAHDAPKPAPNVLQTIGAPHRVTPELLAEAAAEWREKLAPLPTPRIAVLAGGDSRSAQFTAQDFHELGTLASEMAASLNGGLMVSTSRRTSKKQADYLRLALTAESEFFAWEAHAPNPYHAFLGLAEIIIVTGDSMSMCAEACGTGKPVYIYVPRQGSLAPKLRHLHESLIEKGLARYLTANPETDWQPTAPLNEAKRVAMEMMGRR
jgi:mitochondrial fission protein ELM1